ncbi:MAG TPA: hypothetical protein DDY76_08660 [Opitutae bacterium]|nr:hypothetical protein [Opitutae bacterium]
MPLPLPCADCRDANTDLHCSNSIFAIRNTSNEVSASQVESVRPASEFHACGLRAIVNSYEMSY